MIVTYPIKIAVVDDDATQLAILKGFLGSNPDFEVTYFDKATAALEAIKKENFRVLITDLMMPTMPGDTLLREISNLQKGIVCIVITGGKTYVETLTCFNAGAWNYIKKPIQKDQLDDTLSLVKDHFDRWNQIFKKMVEDKKG